MAKFPGIKGIFFDEDPLTEQSSKGVNGIGIPDCGLKKSDLRKDESAYIDSKYIRKNSPGLPEVRGAFARGDGMAARALPRGPSAEHR